MIKFYELTGPFVVRFLGEGMGCGIRHTPQGVKDLLMGLHGAGLSIDSTSEEVDEWLADDDNWSLDEKRKPFEWSFNIGETAGVAVTVVGGVPDDGYEQQLIEEQRAHEAQTMGAIPLS